MLSVLNEEFLESLKRFLGFILLRDYRYKKAVIFVGAKDSGKTTLLKLIITFIGEKNISGVALQQFGSDKFATANLKGKLANIVDDLSFTDLKSTGQFKMGTGNGFMTGEIKFGEQFQFRNYSKLIFATNKIPPIKDVDDDAYFGRWLLFLFENIFDENNPNTKKNIAEELISDEEEMSGLLNWALDGLDSLLKENSFKYPLSEEQVKELMQSNSISSIAFISDCLREEQGSWIAKSDLYQIYSAWCHLHKQLRHSEQKFYKDMENNAQFCTEVKHNCKNKKDVRGYFNLGLNLIEETETGKAGISPLLICNLFFHKPIIMVKHSILDNSTFVYVTKKYPAFPVFKDKEVQHQLAEGNAITGEFDLSGDSK